MNNSLPEHRMRRPRRRTAGLGMVELLVSLAIMAMLLTSVAAAFHASMETVEENQKITTVTHNARIVLNRMMAEIRQADAIEYGTNFVKIVPPSMGALKLTEYRVVNGAMSYHQTFNEDLPTSHVILGPEDGITINRFVLDDLPGNVVNGDGVTIPCIDRLTVELDLSVGSNHFAVTASTNPRRNLDW